MSDKMNISATEHGIVRLFTIETAQAFDHAGLAKALGVDAINEKHADIITIDDLDELGLEGYLTLGMGIPAQEVAAMRVQLALLKGDVAVIRSAAFNGKATTLAPQEPLRWIASFGEVPLDTASTPIKTASAQGHITGKAPPPRPSNNKVLLWILGAFALIVLITISMFIRITP
ncbi:hypothetical protein [Planktotalea arctica]|uniref:hypothetical protein n=1 Tax=Planktotalea arctica TaxID=1481893 RepID=UPI000A170E43|nr:hypothetical protein [Planktotalea arctica]